MYKLFFVIVSISIGSGIINPLMGPILFSDAGFFAGGSNAERIQAYSLIMAVYAIGMILGNPVWGALSNRLGGHRALNHALSGSVLGLLFCLAGLFFTSFPLFLIGRSMDGLMAGRRTIVLSMLSSGRKDTVDVFRRAEMMNAIGLLIGPVASGLLVASSPGLPLRHYSGPLVAMLVLLLLNLVVIRDPVLAAPRSGRAPGSGGSFVLLKRALPRYFSFFMFQLGWYLFFFSLTPYITVNLDFSPMMIGVFFFSLTLLYILALAALFPFLKRRLSDVQSACLAFMTGICSLWSMWLWGDDPFIFLAGGAGVVTAAAIVTPLFSSSIADAGKPAGNGVALGFQNALVGFAWLAATFSNGYLTAMSPLAAFALAASCFLFASLFIGLLSLEKAGFRY
ncbi:MFS transporter [Castellaniella sp. WN]